MEVLPISQAQERRDLSVLTQLCREIFFGFLQSSVGNLVVGRWDRGRGRRCVGKVAITSMYVADSIHAIVNRALNTRSQTG